MKKKIDFIRRHNSCDILKYRKIPDTLLNARVDINTENKILKKKLSQKYKRMAEIITGGPQICPLSTTLFSIYVDIIITK